MFYLLCHPEKFMMNAITIHSTDLKTIPIKIDFLSLFQAPIN